MKELFSHSVVCKWCAAGTWRAQVAIVKTHAHDHFSAQPRRHTFFYWYAHWWWIMSIHVWRGVGVCVLACVRVCVIEPSSSSVSGLKRLWDEWEQRIKERLHVWPCIILDILNAAFVKMGAAYKKWHCAVAERACGLNSMTNLSPRIILFNLPRLYVFDILLHSVTLSWMDNFKDF